MQPHRTAGGASHGMRIPPQTQPYPIATAPPMPLGARQAMHSGHAGAHGIPVRHFGEGGPSGGPHGHTGGVVGSAMLQSALLSGAMSAQPPLRSRPISAGAPAPASMAGRKRKPEPYKAHSEPVPFDTTKPFEGTFELDLNRSQPMTAHLSALGVSELGCKAAEKLEVRIIVEQTGTSPAGAPTAFDITHKSNLGTRTRKLRVDEEWKERARDNTDIKSKLVVDEENTLKILNSFSGGSVTDIRTIESGGRAMLQYIKLMTKTGDIVETRRLFTRVFSAPAPASVPPPPVPAGSAMEMGGLR